MSTDFLDQGLLEKNLCLDVALRLGQLIEQNIPSAQGIYTRKDDRHVPLEERTAIANDANADLFISIHANSSDSRQTRGVETYYVSLATSQESKDLATRENSRSSISAGLSRMEMASTICPRGCPRTPACCDRRMRRFDRRCATSSFFSTPRAWMNGKWSRGTRAYSRHWDTGSSAIRKSVPATSPTAVYSQRCSATCG